MYNDTAVAAPDRGSAAAISVAAAGPAIATPIPRTVRLGAENELIRTKHPPWSRA
jgi:hypothetical protein